MYLAILMKLGGLVILDTPVAQDTQAADEFADIAPLLRKVKEFTFRSSRAIITEAAKLAVGEFNFQGFLPAHLLNLGEQLCPALPLAAFR